MSNLSYYSKSATPFSYTTLDLPPCCLEFVPYEYGQGQWFVVGTYGLKNDQESTQGSQSRHGALNLYHLSEKLGALDLQLIQKVPYQAGVYSLQFLPGTSIFAITTTIGCISIFNVVQSSVDQFNIEHVATHQIFDGDEIITSCAWCPVSELPRLAATTSNGSVSLIQFRDKTCKLTDAENEREDIFTHERYGEPQYAYCCAWSGSTLFSGGDDSYLWMMKICNRNSTSEVPSAEKFEPHAAGVLAILPFTLPSSTEPSEGRQVSNTIILTGGYDDYFRVYSPQGQLKVLAELHLGQGVYKLKFLEEPGSISPEEDVVLKILASCTNAGVRILLVTGKDGGRGDWSIAILASMTQHRSLCYASDVMPISPTEKARRRIVASTSMYDKQLCIWEFDENAWKEEADGISKTRDDDELVKSEVIYS